MLELPTLLWKEYKIQICIIAVIVGVLDMASLSDATKSPWTPLAARVAAGLERINVA